MVIAKYFTEFCLFSFLGWIYECIYCSVKTKHWENRGFLYGPVCPIYGSGATAVLFVFGDLAGRFFRTRGTGEEIPVWMIFLICAVGSAILEYGTSYILEKKFHARWWDYSHAPLNVNGRICLPATIGFGVAGVVIARYLLPVVSSAEGMVPPIAYEAIALVLMFLFGMDMAMTISSLTQLGEKLDQAEAVFNARMEAGMEAGMAKVGAGVANLQGIKDTVLESSEEFEQMIKEMASGFTARQKYHLTSVRRFMNERRGSIVASIMKKLPGRQKPEDEKSDTQTTEI